MISSTVATLLLLLISSKAFAPAFRRNDSASLRTRRHAGGDEAIHDATGDAERATQKKALLQLLGRSSEQGQTDPVLADPETKEPIRISTAGTLLGGSSRPNIKYDMQSSTNQYGGSSDSFLNLLEPKTDDSSFSTNPVLEEAVKPFTVFIPPPLRSIFASSMAAGASDDNYIPMRDLFTSPAVSFAYERGWRQGFARAGFPGPDIEYQMARDYFAPAVTNTDDTSNKKKSTVVDMSCATGLFTRRFAKSDEYDRVLGCDYSESMLTEARRRIRSDPSLLQLKRTKLDLVRLDVGKIPMQDGSVEALHAGAAMHCWPDLERAAKEIYRVLKPGGRYFATTFLSSYFATLQAADGGMMGSTNTSSQAFQYFESVDELRKLMESGGFEQDKIQIEVLGAACVVIRCEK